MGSTSTIEPVTFSHIRDCDTCGTERSRPEFNMHDPRTRENYYFCSATCAQAFDKGLKVARRLGVPA